MQKLLNNTIKSVGRMKVEIRHLKDYDNIVATINANK